jgi:hypothetical protein
MNKFEDFKKFMHIYRNQVIIDSKLSSIGLELNPDNGILSVFDEFLSWIPDLILSPEYVDPFWNLLEYDYFEDSLEEFDRYVEELWIQITGKNV